MKILDDMISSLSEDSVVREVHTCALWTAVLSRGCGLAATFHITHSLHGMVREADNLRARPAHCHRCCLITALTSLPERESLMLNGQSAVSVRGLCSGR